MVDSFPFETASYDGNFRITFETSGDDEYAVLFEKYGYVNNGYGIESHIIQMLEKIDPQLLPHINFDSELDTFCAFADTEINQLKFTSLISPIFKNLEVLRTYLQNADRERIDD